MALTLPELLHRGIDLLGGSQTLLADRLQINRSSISRALRGEYSLDFVYCIRLAHLLQLSIPEVLRAAGKSEEATLLEDVLLARVSPARSALERNLLLLDSDEQAAITHLITMMVRCKKRRRPRPTDSPVLLDASGKR